jgi:hypothetical protein
LLSPASHAVAVGSFSRPAGGPILTWIKHTRRPWALPHHRRLCDLVGLPMEIFFYIASVVAAASIAVAIWELSRRRGID